MDRTRCSVEMEPRTLNRGDLHSAREEAMVIVQNKEPVEASNIFTQDTRLVVNERNKLHEFVGVKESWKCSSTNSEELCINPTKLKEPLSSPF